MIFDKLCKLVELHQKKLLPLMHDAALFEFPDCAGQTRNTQAEQFDDFFLPFPVVALEITGGYCALISDMVPKQRGLFNEKRLMAYYQPTSDGRAWFFIAVFQFVRTQNPSIPVIESRVRMYEYSSGGLLDIPSTTPAYQEWETKATDMIGAAIWYLMNVNQPDAFVFEDAPLKPKKLRSGDFPRVWRSPERPKYTILEPRVIRQRLNIDEPMRDGKPLAEGHTRRRHFHTFRDERFVRMRGKTIVIDACWVGPTEKVVGNHRYKVRIDL